MFLLSLHKYSGGDIESPPRFLVTRRSFGAAVHAGGALQLRLKQRIRMIDSKALAAFIEKHLEGSDLYLVGVTVSPDNRIEVEIDSEGSVDIDRCVELTRAIEGEWDRDAEDYELEVGSAGLTSPLKVPRQYRKYLGREVEVLGLDGKKRKGLLRDAGDEGFTILCEEKVKPEGAKRATVEQVPHTYGYGDVKYTKYLIKF